MTNRLCGVGRLFRHRSMQCVVHSFAQAKRTGFLVASATPPAKLAPPKSLVVFMQQEKAQRVVLLDCAELDCELLARLTNERTIVEVEQEELRL